MTPSSSFTTQIEIAAPVEVVWAALTQPAGRRRWLNDAEVVSTWALGADVTIDVVLEGRVRRDRGTVEAADAPDFLRYSLWSSISRRADRPEHRSVVSFRLAPAEGRGTRLTVDHEQLGAATAQPHAAFFWPVALAVLRDELEGREPGPLDLRAPGT